MGKLETSSAWSSAVEITSAAPDSVVGRLTVPGGRSAGSPLGLLTDFAGQLASAGAVSALGPMRKAQEIECRTSLFSRHVEGRLKGAATLLFSDGSTMNWQILVHDEEGKTVCAVSMTHLVVQAEPTAIGEPAEPLSNSGEPVSDDASSADEAMSPADKRRAQIAAAAAAVIARKGFGNATMREIADTAGMHVPTMYQYVASKDEMLELVYIWTMARVRTDVDLATVNCSTATEKLRATITAIIDKGDRFGRDVGVLNRELKSLSPAARIRVLAEYRKLLLQIAQLVSDGIGAGEFRAVEPEIAANFVDAVCDIWALRPFAVRQFGQAAFHDEVAELILRGLRT
jgi:AcrR family transcriptional regulator/acyl-coenzyme A thioesterase PaaI-like protein